MKANRIKIIGGIAAGLLALGTAGAYGVRTLSVAEESSSAWEESESSRTKKSSQATSESSKASWETMSSTAEAEPETAVPETVMPLDNEFIIPAYSGKAYVVLNNNQPAFSSAELTATSYETYSRLDSLGRCGVAIACIGKDLMPTTDRGAIGSVKPSGWKTVKYDCVDGKYLYNRCHLIGYQLTGENANNKNLITGTRYMNTKGMLPFENMVADYIKETGNHVLYRVTPVFEKTNLLCHGVQMEAESVEDKGAGILYNVFCYNVQPSITINYTNGDSALGEPSRDPITWTMAAASAGVSTTAATTTAPPTTAAPTTVASTTATPTTAPPTTAAPQDTSPTVYVSNAGKIHTIPNCSGMKYYTTMTYNQAIQRGHKPCKNCCR